MIQDFSAASFIDWARNSQIQLIITAVVIGIYVLLDRISAPRLEESADQGRFSSASATHAIRIARILFALFGVLLLAVTWGVDLATVVVFATTVITLTGVALFATWSLLSNVTAYFILMVHPSVRRGSFIRVIDLDNYAEGYVAEINLFNTRLVTENRETIIYPNNLLLGRPMLVNPRDRLQGIGKLEATRTESTVEARTDNGLPEH